MKTITIDYDTYLNELQFERQKQFNHFKRDILNKFPGLLAGLEVDHKELVEYITEYLLDI